MLKTIYIILAVAIVGFYTLDAIYGWEYGNPEKKTVPAEARRSPGWSHSGTSHFWYSGYRGGK